MPVPEEFRSIPGEDEILREHAAAITALCRHRLLEARIDVVAVYLEHYASDVLPYNVIETLNRMKQEYITPEAPIHPTIQIRLANSIHRILSDARFIDLSDIIINLCFWDLYAAGDKSEWEIQAHREELSLTLGAENGPYERGPSSTSHFWPWLDAPVARQKVKDAFKAHEMNLMFTTESARDVLLRLRRMLKGINCWHPS
jgi:hypothetical protein